jgi:hypothetical protein
MDRNSKSVYYVKTYFREVFEAFISVLIISHMNPKIKFEWERIIKLSFTVGTITFLLELYNPQLCSTAKNGMFYGVANSWSNS